MLLTARFIAYLPTKYMLDIVHVAVAPADGQGIKNTPEHQDPMGIWGKTLFTCTKKTTSSQSINLTDNA